jgi:hypothetical protein
MTFLHGICMMQVPYLHCICMGAACICKSHASPRNRPWDKDKGYYNYKNHRLHGRLMSNRVVSEERVVPPAAGGYPPRPPKSPTVWCHSRVTGPCKTQFTLAPPGHAVTEYSSWHTGHAITKYSSWHKHNARTDSVSRVSALLRVSATVGLLCWTRGLGGPEYVL